MACPIAGMIPIDGRIDPSTALARRIEYEYSRPPRSAFSSRCCAVVAGMSWCLEASGKKHLWISGVVGLGCKGFFMSWFRVSGSAFEFFGLQGLEA